MSYNRQSQREGMQDFQSPSSSSSVPLCCHSALGMPVWALPPVRRRTIPLPPPYSPPSLSPTNPQSKTRTVACSERKCLPVHKNNCLQKSLERADCRLSTAYSSTSGNRSLGWEGCGGHLPASSGSFSAPLSTGGKRKGPGWEVSEKSNFAAASSSWPPPRAHGWGPHLGRAGCGNWSILSWGTLSFSQGHLSPPFPCCSTFFLALLTIDS